MSGHVAPWCLDCGIEDHDPALFDPSTGNLWFDDVAEDLKVLTSRFGDHTTDQLCGLMGYDYRAGRQMIHRALLAGRIPEPMLRGRGNQTASVWSAAQVATIVYFKQLAAPEHERVPECGSYAAYRRHRRLHERVDDDCRQAASAARAVQRTTVGA